MPMFYFHPLLLSSGSAGGYFRCGCSDYLRPSKKVLVPRK